MRGMFPVSVGVACLLAGAPAAPHHSFAAEFGINRPIELTGTVTTVEWTNPHAWIFMDVEDDDGNVQNWAIELLGVNTLIRRGWTPDTLEAGHVIDIEGYGARDGSNTGNASMVVMADTDELLSESATNQRRPSTLNRSGSDTCQEHSRRPSRNPASRCTRPW